MGEVPEDSMKQNTAHLELADLSSLRPFRMVVNALEALWWPLRVLDYFRVESFVFDIIRHKSSESIFYNEFY
jgi:hypothetical protein